MKKLDNLIIKIEKYLDEDFEKELFKTAIYNLKDKKNKLRFNNFAYAIRELTRHFLSRLSPDKEILKCSWYKNEIADKENGITRKQRAIYAIQGGLSDKFLEDELEMNIKDIHKELIASINLLSKYTHIEKKTFYIDEKDTFELSYDVLNNILQFLDMIFILKNEVIEHLYNYIDKEILDTILQETIMDLDLLATHHYIESYNIDYIIIENIDYEKIYLKIYGSLDCKFQYGSNADIKRDDGLIIDKSVPFECQMFSFTKEPQELYYIDNSLSSDATIDDIFT